MRRRLPWLLALPLMAAGSLAAHALSYLFTSAHVPTEGHELAERSSTGLAAHSVVVLGIVGALAGLAAASRLLSRLRGHTQRGVSPPLFFWLPPLAFTIQELSERLLRAEAAPFHAALEPRFLIGLALQIPFGLVSLLFAWLLVQVARRLVQALGRVSKAPLRRRSTLTRPLVGRVPPRIPALALGYPQRGPPGA